MCVCVCFCINMLALVRAACKLIHSVTRRACPIHTPAPSQLYTSTIPFIHQHHPIYTPAPSHSYTSTIPIIHQHHPIYTPAPSHLYTSTIPFIHQHLPIHTPAPSQLYTSAICRQDALRLLAYKSAVMYVVSTVLAISTANRHSGSKLPAAF